MLHIETKRLTTTLAAGGKEMTSMHVVAQMLGSTSSSHCSSRIRIQLPPSGEKEVALEPSGEKEVAQIENSSTAGKASA
jgi:hypothetical protein